jgi:AraC family transcriptional activator of mtrCDE
VLEDGNGPPEQLVAGDIILFPAGGAHLIHDGSGEPAKPEFTSNNASLVVVENDGIGETADFLCGRFLLGAVPDRLLRDHLPGRMVVRSALPDQAVGAGGPERSISHTRLMRLIGLMKEEALDPGPGSEMLVSHFSAALFALTLRFATEAAQQPVGLMALARRPRLQPAVSAMFEKPGEPWTLDELSSLCNMSKATFVRQFQEAIGRSASDLLTEVRMTIVANSEPGRRNRRVGRLSIRRCVSARLQTAYRYHTRSVALFGREPPSMTLNYAVAPNATR